MLKDFSLASSWLILCLIIQSRNKVHIQMMYFRKWDLMENVFTKYLVVFIFVIINTAVNSEIPGSRSNYGRMIQKEQKKMLINLLGEISCEL